MKIIHLCIVLITFTFINIKYALTFDTFKIICIYPFMLLKNYNKTEAFKNFI